VTLSNHPFHSKLVPLYEWEGILFVGIPLGQNFNDPGLVIEGHWQLVLADPDKLTEFWALHFENISKNAKPEASNAHFKQVAPENLFDVISSSRDIEDKPITASHLDVPEGLNLNSSVESHIQRTDEIWSELTLKASLDNGNKVELPDLLDLPQPPKPPKLPDQSIPTSLPELPELLKLSDSPTATPVAHESETEKNEKTILITPEVRDSKQSSQLLNNKGFIKKNYVLPDPYRNIMQLTLQGNRLRVIDFNGNPTGTTVDLSAPSPFRIVYRTRNDYHGHIVPCLTLEKFFAETNKSAVPPFITILPILNDHQLEGMLIAWSETDIQSISHLNALKESLKHAKLNSAA
jgi:hypothetical protein